MNWPLISTSCVWLKKLFLIVNLWLIGDCWKGILAIAKEEKESSEWIDFDDLGEIEVCFKLKIFPCELPEISLCISSSPS